MILKKILVWICGLTLVFAGPVSAHFGMVIPSDSMIMLGDSQTLSLTISFLHPFEGIGMQLDKPRVFGVLTNGNRQDLTGFLVKKQLLGHTAWETDYQIKRPGVYLFYMEPEPYWEPAEDSFIIHYTKTVVAAFGDDQGWDSELGLKTEIVPLAKPYGLYTGNVFQGIVKLDGKPVPFAEVEVEYYNEDQKSAAPTVYMITQTIKADPNGIFTYAVPKSGWWGFAALNPADYRLQHNGEDKAVELGAVIWVEFLDWQER